MKPKRIVIKLFLTTISIFALLLSIQFIFQNVFMEQFYIDSKVKNLEKNIETFSNNYKNSNWNTKQTNTELSKFSELNNSAITIVNKFGDPIYDLDVEGNITLQDDNGNVESFTLDELYAILDSFQPQIGDELELKYINFNDESYDSKLIHSIKYDGSTYNLAENLDDILHDEDPSNYSFEEFTGKIIFLFEPNDMFFGDYDYTDELLQNELLDIFIYPDDLADSDTYYENYVPQLLNSNDQINYYWSEDPATNLKHIIFYKKILIKGDTHYIFALTSLQSINEAISFMNNYNIYMLFLAIFLILLLSFLYSKMIATPLIRMNKAAKQMAELDFDVYCDIKTGDELESLSDSLNILSDNLQHSLAELQEANSALIEDIEREKEQERIRRDFVANISHELKTPLGIMKGFAEGIKDGIFENKKEYYLDVIIDEIEKMNILILDMLEVSALESKAYTLSEENFDINSLITKLNTRFDPLFKKHNLALELSLESNTVIGDKLKIEQVLMNLISNAIRYSNSNETIRIKTISNKAYTRISIENTGTHIPEADLPKIWDRFYRVEKSRNKSKGGTGLGLLIVKNILELHNYNYGMKNTIDGVEVFFEMKSK